MKSFCSTCSRPTNQAVIAEKVINESDDFGMWWSDTNYQIIQCQGCDTISFRRLYDDITRQGYAEEDTTTQELFPKRGSHSRPLKPFKNIPGEIKKISWKR